MPQNEKDTNSAIVCVLEARRQNEKDTNSAIVCVLEAAAKPRRRPQKQTLAGFHAENCRMVHATPWLRNGLLVVGVSAGVSACLLVGRACALWAQLAVKTKRHELSHSLCPGSGSKATSTAAKTNIRWFSHRKLRHGSRRPVAKNRIIAVGVSAGVSACSLVGRTFSRHRFYFQ